MTIWYSLFSFTSSNQITLKINNMKNQLTNIRTEVQFCQYGEVKNYTFNGNKLMAMNILRYAFGVKQFSVLREYKSEGFLIQGNYIQNH